MDTSSFYRPPCAEDVLRIFALLTVFMLAGCLDLKPYHTEQEKPPGDGGVTQPLDVPSVSQNCRANLSCTMFVEYDDFGHIFNRNQLNAATETARSVAERKGIIVVYVHGWHHNANPQDEDVRRFGQAISEAGKMDKEKYGDTRHVMGIFVGWRGESIDSNVAMPLSVFTFWERKNTAQAVGDGAVFELFRKLADIREEYPDSRLLLVGHSFGAAVTYSSVSHSITAQITDDLEVNETETLSDEQFKRWDLVILINPAFEAMQLRPQFELARSRDYKNTQLPHLLIITSAADWATKTLFPVGRRISTTFKKYADPESAGMNTTAAGQYLPFITHQLAVSPKCDMKTVNYASSPDERELKTVTAAENYCLNDPRAMLDKPAPLLLTRCDNPGDCGDVAGDHYIKRGPAANGLTPYAFPIMNIRTTSDVMSGHNDIWNSTIRGFLTQMFLISVPPAKMMASEGLSPTVQPSPH
jgi:pimeloyl-ACP methyl ester carboxylesterase